MATAVAGENDGLLGEEGDSDSEEEFDDEGEVDEDEGQYERHVISLPPIGLIEQEDEEAQRSRFVDFEALVAGSESEDDDDNEMEGDEDAEAGAVEAAGGEEHVGGGGGGGEEPEEHEIDGVGFIVRPGQGGGRRSVHAVIESLQSKAHQKAIGYDATDQFIDDDELDNNPESNVGLLEIKSRVPYCYDDFRISTDFEVAKDRKQSGAQQKKKTLKPLKDLSPPPTDELKAAIDAFREVAKAHQDVFRAQAEGKKTFSVPEVLTGPLTRLGRAIEAWHPRKFLVEDIFDYVTDLLPPNTANLKAKARKLIGRATPKELSSSAAASAGGALSQDVLEEAEQHEEVSPTLSSSATLRTRTPTSSAAPSPAVPSPAGVRKPPPVDSVKLGEVKARIAQMLAEQEHYMMRGHPAAEKELLRFKFDDALLLDLEALRSAAHNAGGPSGVALLYSEIVSLFPAGFMTSNRIITKLAQARKKAGGVSARKKHKAEAGDGAAKAVDADEQIDDEDGEGSNDLSQVASVKKRK